ncbi:MAG: FGGY family carbohydrate kinase, partial [Methylophagaceae bacterium]
MCDAYIGIDLGTSGCRVIAIDEQNNIIATEQQSIAIPPTTHLKSEQDPDYQWNVVLQTLMHVVSQCQDYVIKAIAVDATSGSVLITDSQGQAVTPILMYNDARAV